MGLFGGDSRTTVTNRTDVTNVGLEDIEGPGFGQVQGDIVIGDLGAIESAERIARDSLDTFRYTSRDAFDAVRSTTRDSLDTFRYATRDALDVSERIAIDSLQLADESVYRGTQQNETVARVLADAGDSQFQFARQSTADLVGVLDRVIEQTTRGGQAFVGFANDVLQRESTNTDARLETVTRYALIGAAVIAAVALFNRG